MDEEQTFGERLIEAAEEAVAVSEGRLEARRVHRDLWAQLIPPKLKMVVAPDFDATAHEDGISFYLAGNRGGYHAMGPWRDGPWGSRESVCQKCGRTACYSAEGYGGGQMLGSAAKYLCADRVTQLRGGDGTLPCVILANEDAHTVYDQQSAGTMCHHHDIRGTHIPITFDGFDYEWWPQPWDVQPVLDEILKCPTLEPFDAILPDLAKAEEAYLPIVLRDRKTKQWQRAVICWENSD